MDTKVTLKRISDLLNISISTVSRALKDHPDIALQTRQKVKELATMLDYEPNTYAINLRTNTSKVLGLIVPVIANQFYESFIAAVEEESRKSGYTLMILQSNDNEMQELENIKLCKLNRVAGIFVCLSPSTKDLSLYTKLEENGIPVVFFDKVPESTACNKVSIADVPAAEKAAEVIIKAKRKHVLALFSNPDFSITKNRYSTFVKSINSAVPSIRITAHYALSAKEATEIVMKEIQSQKTIDTFFCMSDELLTGAMKVIQQLKLKVPKEIAVIAMSNGFIPTLYEPQVTYVKTSGYELGKLAYYKMLNCLNGDKSHETIFTSFEVIDGGSIG